MGDLYGFGPNRPIHAGGGLGLLNGGFGGGLGTAPSLSGGPIGSGPGLGGNPGLLSSALGGGLGAGLGSAHNTAPGGGLSVGNRYTLASMPGHPSTPEGLLAKNIDATMTFGIRWSSDLITHLIETGADMPANSEILRKVSTMREELERVRAHLLDTWKHFLSSQEESVDR